MATDNKTTSKTTSKTKSTKKTTPDNSKKKPKTVKKESMIKNKVDNLENKNIFKISLIPFLGIALYFYFEKDKEKSNKAIKGFLYGTLIVFVIGVITGGILWIMN